MANKNYANGVNVKSSNTEDDAHPSRNEDEQAIEESGLITLRGCRNIITHWEFPQNNKKCPVQNCPESFDTRTDCIKHYKRQHSMRAIVCNICDRPISTHKAWDFIRHYKRIHPDEVIPFDFSTQQYHQGTSTDLITLRGSGITTHWKFPSKQTNCPVQRCRKLSFDSRSAVIQHYKREHAKISIFCVICEKPIISPSKQKFKLHYKRCHPKVEPFDFVANKKLPKMITQKKVNIHHSTWNATIKQQHAIMQ